jgi:hypothetical protein
MFEIQLNACKIKNKNLKINCDHPKIDRLNHK